VKRNEERVNEAMVLWLQLVLEVDAAVGDGKREGGGSLTKLLPLTTSSLNRESQTVTPTSISSSLSNQLTRASRVLCLAGSNQVDLCRY